MAALVLLFAGLALHGAWTKSETYDEPFTIMAGWSYLQTADYSFNREHPPFGKLLVGLALLPLDPILPADYQNLPAPAYAFFARQPHLSPQQLLFAARLPGVLFGVILLLYVYAWGRLAFGPRAGLVALALAATNPNLLGLSRVAGNDFVMAALAFAACFHVWRWLVTDSRRSLALGGILLGLAVGSKLTALLLFPVIGLVVLGAAIVRRRPVLLLHATLALFAGGGVLWLLYQGEARSLEEARIHARFIPRGGHDAVFAMPYLEDALEAVFGIQRPVPLLSFLKAIDHQVYHADVGHPTYFWGEVRKDSHWAFYLATGALKNPVGTIMLLLLGLVSLRRTHRGWEHEALLHGFTLAMLVLFSRADVQLGFKYMLPAVPFLALMAGRVFARDADGRAPSPGRAESLAGAAVLLAAGIGLSLVFDEPGPTRWIDGLPAAVSVLLALPLLARAAGRRAGASAAGWPGYALVGWAAFSGVADHPHHLVYFNEWGGGPDQGTFYSVVGDDWGQDTALLGRWMAEHDVHEIAYDYYGTADPERWGVYGGPSWVGTNPQPPHGLVAVHVSLQNRLPASFAFLEGREPIAVIGHTIRVYDLGTGDGPP